MRFVFEAAYLPREDHMDAIYCIQELDRAAIMMLIEDKPSTENGATDDGK